MTTKEINFRNEILDEIVRILEPYSVTNVESQGMVSLISNRSFQS